jgi:hypothetical protein
MRRRPSFIAFLVAMALLAGLAGCIVSETEKGPGPAPRDQKPPQRDSATPTPN